MMRENWTEGGEVETKRERGADVEGKERTVREEKGHGHEIAGLRKWGGKGRGGDGKVRERKNEKEKKGRE